MAGLALLARAEGHTVSGCDADVYPPMSTQLAAAGIGVLPGYRAEYLQPAPDQVVVGNAMTRTNPAVEYLLNSGISYTSGPQWLAENILRRRWVLAVAGTHGKTSTSAMLAWILEYAGLQPGFLIGGIPANFGHSARIGGSDFFVIEADEYDSAFFDKRSKFIHYRPRTLVLNNLEYDHADIFPDLAAIQLQFHHLVRTIPGQGLIISNGADERLQAVLAMGCWSAQEMLHTRDWRAEASTPDGRRFEVFLRDKKQGAVEWSQLGEHNTGNALAAIAAARHAGVPVSVALAALAEFQGVKRRLELRGIVRGISVYDDFAHHPTAIRTTLAGLRNHVGSARIIAVLEPRSNSMRRGVFNDTLAGAFGAADAALFYQPAELNWRLDDVVKDIGGQIFTSIDALVLALGELAVPGDHILVMSNGGFGAIHQRLLAVLEAGAAS